jgi:lysophospholipase L1-like esterase
VKKELLAKDGLHLSEAGYKLWTSLTLPLIGKPDKQ